MGGGAPTGDGGSEAPGLENHEAVLQAAPAHSLGTNQNQSLPLEGRDLGHLLVDLQLVSVKLWRGKEVGGRGGLLMIKQHYRGDLEITKRGREEGGGVRGRGRPAFLAVRYIIFFFFFPAMVPHRIPAEQTEGEYFWQHSACV